MNSTAIFMHCPVLEPRPLLECGQRRPLDCALPCSDEPVQKKRRDTSSKKSVRFAPLASVRHRHLSDADLYNAWLHPEDYQANKLEAREELVTIKKLYGQLAPEDLCIRGLERAILKMFRKQPNYHRRQLAHSVLREQRAQRNLGVHDIDALRTVSVQFSADDKSFAQDLASAHF
jgi:hypothetical protein